jgi:hypothetical protein
MQESGNYMTLTNAIESAFYDLLRAQEMGAKPPLIRCWHSLRKDQSWDQTIDRVLSCIDIRCSPFITSDNKLTGSCRVQITAKTNGEDDRDHAMISLLEEAITNAIDSLYGAQYSNPTGATWTAFEASIKADFPTVETIGGIDMEQGEEPSDDDGKPTVGFVVNVSITKTDY